MIKNFDKLINDIATGNEIDAFEAAKKLACNKVTNIELNKLEKILESGIGVHNKEAATYAISWTKNGSSALAILIEVLANLENDERVRGQAAEGIGLIRPSRKYKLRKNAEAILLKSLRDSSPIVRFWSCYSAGVLKMKNAISILQELQANDHSVCPGWWYVSEEAEDAVEHINNRPGKVRLSINQRIHTGESASNKSN